MIKVSKLAEWLDEVCGKRIQRPVTSSPNDPKTVQECAEAHKDKPCFREKNGHSLCKGCSKREKKDGQNHS